MSPIETDHLVSGAGAPATGIGIGMAFVDTLLTGTDAQTVLVGRRHRASCPRAVCASCR